MSSAAALQPRLSSAAASQPRTVLGGCFAATNCPRRLRRSHELSSAAASQPRTVLGGCFAAGQCSARLRRGRSLSLREDRVPPSTIFVSTVLDFWLEGE